MAKAVGIDIGSRACKVAVIHGGPKGAKLLHFVEKEYELDDDGVSTPSTILDALRKALSEAKAPKQAACLALPAEQCILREISVPFTQDDQIAKIAKFEFEPHLHSAAIEDVVIDYVKTGPARAGTRLLVFACIKEVLSARLTQLASVGVDPLHVDVDVTALFNVAHATGALEEHPNCLIIDIGARTTKTLYIQDGGLKVARSIRLGSASARKRLVGDFQGDEKAADQALEQTASAELLAQAPIDSMDTVEIVTSVGEMEALVAKGRSDEFMKRVMRETQRTLPMMGDAQAVTAVFLTGGGSAQHPNARAQLEERFGAPVMDLPVSSAVTHDLAPSDADVLATSGAIALGAALKVVGLDAGKIDLRQEEFRFARTFDQVKNALATGVTLTFFAVFLFWLSLFMENQTATKELGALKKISKQELADGVFDAYTENVRDARSISINDDNDRYFQSTRSALKKIQDHLKNELGLATEIPPIISGLETWQAVMSSVASVRDKIEFIAIKQEDYEQDKAIVTFVVSDYPDADTIVLALKKHSVGQGGTLFDEVNTRVPRNTKDGRIEVPIEMVLVPREGSSK